MEAKERNAASQGICAWKSLQTPEKPTSPKEVPLQVRLWDFRFCLKESLASWKTHPMVDVIDQHVPLAVCVPSILDWPVAFERFLVGCHLLSSAVMAACATSWVSATWESACCKPVEHSGLYGS